MRASALLTGNCGVENSSLQTSAISKWHYHLLLIVLVWGCSQWANYMVLGIRLGGDSSSYMSGASSVIQSLPLEGRAVFSLPYVYVLAGFSQIGASLTHVVIFQCVVALLISFLIYLSAKLCFSWKVGLIASLLFLVNPDIQRWNFYILPETIGTASLVLTTTLAIFYRKDARWVYLLLASCFILGLIRPDTIYLLIPLAVYWTKKDRKLSYFLLFVLFAGILFYSANLPSRFNQIIIDTWSKGEIIWGYSGLSFPPEANVDVKDFDSWWKLLAWYFLSDPLWFFKILFIRLTYFLGHHRPFYSLFHNLFAVVSSLVIYILAIVGTVTNKGALRFNLTVWGIFLLQLAVCMGICVDWDGRFYLRVLPLLLIVVSAGVVVLWERISIRNLRNNTV